MGTTFSTIDQWWNGDYAAEDRITRKPPTPPTVPVTASTAYITAACCTAFGHGLAGVRWGPALLTGAAAAGVAFGMTTLIETKKIFGNDKIRTVNGVLWTSVATGLVSFFGFALAQRVSLGRSLMAVIAGTSLALVVATTRLAA